MNLPLIVAWLGFTKDSRGTRIPNDINIFFLFLISPFWPISHWQEFHSEGNIVVIDLGNIDVDQSFGINMTRVISMSIITWLPI